MNVAEFIDALGGTGAVARHLRVLPSAVSNAKRSGKLPGLWHVRLLRWAEEQGIQAPDSLFEPGDESPALPKDEAAA